MKRNKNIKLDKNGRKNKSHKNMREYVEPIKSDKKLHELEHELLAHGNYGREYYTIFMVSMKCLLRMSDVLKLKYSDVFDSQGHIIDDVYTHDKKTNKVNILDFSVLHTEMNTYHDWLTVHHIHSNWLFPAPKNYHRAMSRPTYYMIIKRVGAYIGVHAGTHLGRKCGAYRLYKSTQNLPLVMRALGHAKESTTCDYLGIPRPAQHNALHALWTHKNN